MFRKCAVVIEKTAIKHILQQFLRHSKAVFRLFKKVPALWMHTIKKKFILLAVYRSYCKSSYGF